MRQGLVLSGRGGFSLGARMSDLWFCFPSLGFLAVVFGKFSGPFMGAGVLNVFLLIRGGSLDDARTFREGEAPTRSSMS